MEVAEWRWNAEEAGGSAMQASAASRMEGMEGIKHGGTASGCNERIIGQRPLDAGSAAAG